MTATPDEVRLASSDLQAMCERGQEQLMRMEYMAAEATLASAERAAWARHDWDTLSRLYMPLQEARRQRRQRCGEGVVCLDLLAEGPDDRLDARHVVENYPHGQLLVAGWGSTEPAAAVRRYQAEHGLYVETFLGAVYRVRPRGVGEAGRVVVIVPLEEVSLPAVAESDDEAEPVDALVKRLPAASLVLPVGELPRGSRPGTPETFGEVMALWERLHGPFLADADRQTDPVRRMEGYRTTIRVDYASELAHQKLSDVARQLLRESKRAARTGLSI